MNFYHQPELLLFRSNFSDLQEAAVIDIYMRQILRDGDIDKSKINLVTVCLKVNRILLGTDLLGLIKIIKKKIIYPIYFLKKIDFIILFPRRHWCWNYPISIFLECIYQNNSLIIFNKIRMEARVKFNDISSFKEICGHLTSFTSFKSTFIGHTLGKYVVSRVKHKLFSAVNW